MQNLNNKGDLKIGPLIMKQMAKKWFDTYSDAEIWMLNSGMVTDQTIYKEGGRYFIFIEEPENSSRKKQSL